MRQENTIQVGAGAVIIQDGKTSIAPNESGLSLADSLGIIKNVVVNSMKKFKTREYESDCRIVGGFNGGTLAIARAVTKEVLPLEKMHLHKKVIEYYIFLKGSAEMLVDGEKIQVTKGDVLMIEPGEEHKLNRIIEEVDYITIRDSVVEDKVFVSE